MGRMIRVALVVCSLLPTLAAADTIIAALGGGKTSEWVVTNAAGGSTLTNLSERRAIEIQNLGPNAIYCTVDGSAPVATTNGRMVAATSGTWALDVGASVTIRCIAATAAQVSGAATMVTELR